MVQNHSSTAAVTPLPSSSDPSNSSTSAESRSVALGEWRMERMQEMEGTVEHLRGLLKQERTYYAPCMDYLSAIASSAPCPVHYSSGSSVTSSLSDSSSYKSLRSSSSSAAAAAAGDRVNEAWRRKLCEWCFEVVDHFGMEREVVSVAMNYLDRVVAKTTNEQQPGCERHIAKRQFQLVTVASLYLAVKLHGETEDIDMDRRRFNVDVFVELSRGFFQADTIEAMEVQILFYLDWHLNPPTPLKFIASLMRLLPMWSQADYADDEHQASFRTVFKAMFDIAMYLTELSVCVSTFSFHSSNSVVAYASILCAMEALEDFAPLPYDVRVRFINNVAEATGLFPESENVRSVRNLLMELCPAIQERDVASLIVVVMGDEEWEDDAGKASPVCVSRVVPEADPGVEASRNKRTRIYSE